MSQQGEMNLVQAADALCEALAPLRFAHPVSHVYNPLVYARAPHLAYVTAYGQPPKEALLVGMNPGPWGMAQTGVPFGDASMVRDWLGIETPVGKPAPEHPKRPVQGFSCPRSEVSGTRLWGAIRDAFDAPEHFFSRYFVGNYCPLSFMQQSGRNITPDKLPATEREPLFSACDEHLRRMVRYLRPRFVIGIGAFAETRARVALAGAKVTVGRILHPSPANPRANAGWGDAARVELEALGLCCLSKRAPFTSRAS